MAFSTTSILTLIFVLFTGFPVAHATPPITLTGTLTGTFTLLSIRFVGHNNNNAIVVLSGTDTILGDISGTCTDVAPITLVFHSDGSANIRGKCVGSATILGRTGTYVKSFAGNISATGELVYR